MKNIFLIVFSVSTFLTAASQAEVATNKCVFLFNYNKTNEWRSHRTQLNQESSLATTTSSREAEIRRSVKELTSTILEEATPVMAIFVEKGADINIIREGGDYGTGITPIYGITNVKNGKLKITMTLPVSGHVGVDNAKKWATTDKYDILMRINGQTSYLAKNVKSLDLVTIQEIEVPLLKDQVVDVLYSRQGSAGPYGFIEGRLVGFKWDGN